MSGNLRDYVRWRGDLTLGERAFTVIDSLVLSALAYVDLDGLVPGPGQGSVTVIEAARLALARGETTALERSDNIRRLSVADDGLLLDLGAARRFASARLSDFVDVVDPDVGTQFAAVTIVLDDGTSFVAYRGTDNTILGWREDFTLSFQVVPAQHRAASYLRRHLDEAAGLVRVGGHSKGGNLALFAAATLPVAEQDLVAHVYNHDGPGLSPQSADLEGLERLADRVTTVVPEFAVIGALFAAAPPTQVVSSTARGIVQHDLMTWQIDGERFVTRERLSPRSVLANQVVASWLEDATDAQRLAFTDSLFSALAAGGATLVVDIGRHDYGSFESVLFALGSSRADTRGPVRLWGRAVLKALASLDLRSAARDQVAVRAGVLALLGSFFICVPTVATQVLGSLGLFVALAVVTTRVGRYFFKWKRGVRLTWPRAVLWFVVQGAALVLLTQIDLLVLPMNLVLGVGLVLHGWATARRGLDILERRRHRGRAVAMLVSASVAGLLGITALSTASHVMPFFVMQTGQYLFVAGAIELFLVVRDRARRLRAQDAIERFDIESIVG